MPNTPQRGIDRPDLRESREQREQLNLRTYDKSEKGDKKDKNEDAFVVGEDYAAVFDGLGGHYGGDIASGLAKDTVKVLMETLDRPESINEAKTQVLKILRQTQERIVEKKDEYFQVEFKKYKEQGGEKTFLQFLDQVFHEGGNILEMGTTGVVMRFLEENGELHAVVGSLGDARGYVFREAIEGEEDNFFVTLDHSMLAKVKTNKTPQELQNAFDQIDGTSDIPPTAKNLLDAYDKRHKVTAAFGDFMPDNRTLKTKTEKFTPRIYDVEVNDGDFILLTTDGIHDNLTRDEMRQTVTGALEQGVDPAEALVRNAKTRSREYPEHDRAKDDDMTAVLVTSEDAKDG
jgi:serine/threonine protein phosphatase PrpC